MSNKTVVECFRQGKSSSAKNLRSNGVQLFSYNLKIAEWKDGQIIVYDYTSKSGNFVSVTTQQHIGLLLRAMTTGTHKYIDAHLVVDPSEDKNGI